MSSALTRQTRQYYARYHQSNTLAAIGNDHLLKVPDDVVRVETHTPCTYCGVAHGCKHRPWMLVA